MLVPKLYHYIIVMSIMRITTRVLALAVPTSLLLSQGLDAAPAHHLSGYDVSKTLLDPEHNQLGAVASESSICSNIGIDMLKEGGNAADSLVATVLCVGVVGMYHSGIGGGGFMLVRSPNGTFEDIDFREKAPAAASEEMYNNNVVCLTVDFSGRRAYFSLDRTVAYTAVWPVVFQAS